MRNDEEKNVGSEGLLGLSGEIICYIAFYFSLKDLVNFRLSCQGTRQLDLSAASQQLKTYTLPQFFCVQYMTLTMKLEEDSRNFFSTVQQKWKMEDEKRMVELSKFVPKPMRLDEQKLGTQLAKTLLKQFEQSQSKNGKKEELNTPQCFCTFL